jgi:N6-adenosine-specific RNA methylase IME4
MKVKGLESVFGKYRTIYLDPPWPYDRRPLGRRDLADIYEGGVMGLEDICSLPISRLGHEEGYVVFLWCPWPKIRDGFHRKVLEAWELQWTSEFVWDKISMGMGRWLRKQTELLLVALPKDRPRIRPLRLNQRDIIADRRRKGHSKKPHVFRHIIESLTPGPRIELFARVHPPAWDVWGHEAPEEIDKHRGEPEKVL